jgi:hypothetical protein
MARFEWLSLLCVFLILVTVLLVRLLYLVSLTRALAACDPTRRAMSPGLVWLNVVPFGHLFWRFWAVIAIGNSLRREYDARGLRTGHSFGKGSGLTVAVLAVVSRVVLLVGLLTARLFEEERIALLSLVLCGLLGLVELVVVIVHWAVVAGFTRELETTRAVGGGEAPGDRDPDRNRRDFDEDYRPIPIRRRRSEAEFED